MTTSTGVRDAAGEASPAPIRAAFLLALLTIAATMDSVNSVALVVARGHVMGGVHATPDEVAWVNLAYVAAKLSAFPAAAWLNQRMAAGRLIAASSTLLLVSSVGCAAADDVGVLVLWRVVQGLAGASLLISGQLLLFDLFARKQQPLAQGLFAFGVIMAPNTVSPALQGWAVDTLSWSWIFLINLPLGACGLLAAALIPATKPATGVGRPFDWIGASLLGAAMTAIVFVTQEGSRYNWFDEPLIVNISLLAGLSAVAFAISQITRGKRRALIDPAIFRDQEFSFGFIVSFVAGCALFGSAFVIPGFATNVLGLSPTYAGLLLLPSGLLICAGLLAAGLLIQFKNLNPAKPVPLGIICFMIAMWMLSGSTSESGSPDMTPALLLRGFGLGLLFTSLTVATFGGLDRALLPQGLALFNMGRQIGGQLGMAWMSTYLDHQNALNRSVLSQHIAAGNRMLAERQEMITNLLAGRGLDSEAASQAAIAMIQKALSKQVATLSFNECFIAIALLFLAAAPVIVMTKIVLGRVLPANH